MPSNDLEKILDIVGQQLALIQKASKTGQLERSDVQNLKDFSAIIINADRHAADIEDAEEDQKAQKKKFEELEAKAIAILARKAGS